MGKRRLWKAWESSGDSPLRLKNKLASLEKAPPLPSPASLSPLGSARAGAPPPARPAGLPNLPRSEQGAGRFILGEGMSFRY